MTVHVWIVLAPGGDRPYVSTSPPSEERYQALKKQGCTIYRADVLLPIAVEDGRVRAIAAEVE
jgi:hypothetical protein